MNGLEWVRFRDGGGCMLQEKEGCGDEIERLFPRVAGTVDELPNGGFRAGVPEDVVNAAPGVEGWRDLGVFERLEEAQAEVVNNVPEDSLWI